jgi:hypothetical protein
VAKFETVKSIEDIQGNVKRFIQILEEEEAPVLQRFAKFNYWYYFADLELFVPNLFLGYRNSTKDFAPTKNDGHKGGDAREALESFFNPQKNEKLCSKLKEFAKKHNRNLNTDIRNIFEPKEEFQDSFKRDTIEKINPSKENNQKNGIQSNKDSYTSNNAKYFEKPVQHKPNKTTIEDTLCKIVKNAEQYETQIYKNCINYKKEPIFERVPETKEIWNDIKTFVTSRDDFGKFIRALYMLIFETTKDEDPKNKFENGKPKPIYRLPKGFVKNNTETKHFMDIVDILRHTLGEAHTPSKLKIPEWKVSYPDALEELLNSRIEPQSLEEFQKLQIEIIKRFENAMKTLLEIVKNDLNRSPNP